MDEFLRAELERAFALDDELRAEFAQHEAKRSRVEKRYDGALIYKTTEQPQPQQSAATMDAATEARWNEWAEAHIERALKAYSEAYSEVLTEAMAEVISTIRKELRDEFNAAIGSLRADLTLATGIQRGEIAEIKRNVA